MSLQDNPTNLVDEHFIIRLLKQALIIHRLTDGLEKLGFEASETYDEIGELVFDLMSYGQPDFRSDHFFNTYVKFLSSIDGKKLKDREFVQDSAIELYRQLKNT
ncbi:MAG: hypothetical protein ACOYXT_08110 [Bacteroidota bacterium]